MTSTIMRIKLTIKPDEYYIWSDHWSGSFEPFYIWIENPVNNEILHSEPWIFTTKNWEDGAESTITFVVPLSQPHPPQYFIKVISERWVNLSVVYLTPVRQVCNY